MKTIWNTVSKPLATATHAAIGAFIATASVSSLSTAHDWEIAGFAALSAFVTQLGTVVKGSNGEPASTSQTTA